MAKKTTFHCKSNAQKKAIAASYARKAEKKKSIISVCIKNHKDKNGGHPHVIIENYKDNHVSVGLSTKQKKGKKGGTNYALEKSPLNDGKNSFMRRQGTVAPFGEYYEPRSGTMTANDYAQAKIYAERAKQKYIEKNNKK